MGCNWYWYKKYIKGLNQPHDGIHVGKKSNGWSFLFRGYRDEPFIESRIQWRQFFEREGGIIVNEYGECYDPMLWIEELEAPSKEQRQKEISPQYRGPISYPEIHTSGLYEGQPCEWYDEEGFRFCDKHFN